MANELKKITALPSGTPADTDVVPFVDLATNTTKKALKSELKGEQGNAATVDAGTTTTLPAGQNASVTNVGTTAAAIFNFAIPQGIQGLTGDTGAKVVSVAFVGNDMVFKLDDASTVTLTNAKTDLKGDTGLTGAKITSASFVGDDLVFVLDDTSTVTITGAKTDLKGDTGLTGETGATGKGITSITKTGTVGLVDTYTITYTDETTATFDVTNGEDGTDGTNGTNGTDGEDGISFIWKGAYNPATAYVKNDNVSYNGSSYIAKSSTTGNPPTNATYWDLLAEKGADGIGAGDMLASVYDPANGARQVAFNNELHDAVTVTDTDEIDLTLTGQAIKADIKTGSVAKSKLDSSVQTSLGKADTAIQDISGKQDALGFTPEDVVNKVTSFQATPTDTAYPSEKLVKDSLDLKAPLTAPTFATSITGSYLTDSEILITDADKKIVSAPVATYPSLTELSYVKGVTSSVQNQLDAKLALAGGTMTGNIQLGETSIKLDATLSADEKWSGITTAGTLGATIASGDLCYLNNDDSRWELVDANLSDGYDKQLGICLAGGNDGDTSEFLVFGKVRSSAFPAFTVGSPLYISETAGDITHTQPTTADVAIRLVGFALTAEDLMFNPSNDYIVHV